MNATSGQHPGFTPTQPSPLQGEGFPLIDRFAKTAKFKDGGVARARKLRAEPTRTEAVLWKHLRQFDVRFRRQASIGPYVVDFACHRARLVIEVDGGVHNLTEVAVRDLKRDEWLETQGYRVLRFSTKRVEADIDAVIAEIARAAGLARTPLPLKGEGVGGWGGGTASPLTLEDSVSDLKGDRVTANDLQHTASTPTQPSPLQGEG